MYATVNREAEESRHLRNSEGENIDEGLTRVRSALLSLPKASCPAGFEYRLNRRLQGLDAVPRSAPRTWVSGWLGVGLGLACAAVIALFVFDFQSPPNRPMLAKSEQVSPAAPSPGPSSDQVAATRNSQSVSGTGEENRMAKTDSVPQTSDPAHLSPDQLHQVSGGDAIQGK